MMKSHLSYISLLTVTLLAYACTQDQAPVEDLGRQYYGHDGGGSYPDSRYTIYSPPAQSAAVSSVGESELPPAGQSSGNSVKSQPDNITITDTTPHDPFITPPSKPLEQPPAQAAAAPDNSNTLYPESASPSVYTKDGISLIWPVNGGKIIAHFKGIENDGINIAMSEGEPIMAAASGVVVYSGNDLKDYGNMIILKHDNSWLTAYANASKIVAKKGSYVKQGDIIAYVGSSGGVKTPQLHFALRKGKVPVDPEQYLPNNGAH